MLDKFTGIKDSSTRVVSKLPDLTKKTQKIWEKIPLFFNVYGEENLTIIVS